MAERLDTLSITEMRTVIEGFATDRGGRLDWALADETRLMARCVLPLEAEILPRDVSTGGVAVRVGLEQVEVRPYLLRLVCTNGAIMLRSVGSVSFSTSVCTHEKLIEALEAAGAPEAFNSSVGSMRSVAEREFDLSFMVVALSKSLHALDRPAMREIFRRFAEGGRTGFGVVNAVTSVARDTEDPEARWRLEEAGGGLAVALLDDSPVRSGAGTLDLPLSETRRRDLQLA